MAKGKGARIRVTLEHKCEQGVYRYHTSKNRRNTTERLELKNIRRLRNDTNFLRKLNKHLFIIKWLQI